MLEIVRAARRNAGWRYVQAHRNAFELRAGGRIELHNQRIVPRDDVALVRRKFEQPIKALQHFSMVDVVTQSPGLSAEEIERLACQFVQL